MEKIKIAFFEIESWEKEYVNEQLHLAEISFFTEPLSQENVAEAKSCDVIACFIDSQLTKEVLSKLPHLRMIATRSTGFDHIDMEFCKAHNITVCNVPTYGENTVAEHTFALILELSRKMWQSIERAREGDFSLDGLRGFDLKGKTLGVIGLGHIGQHVARIANGFEMKVLGFDVFEDKKLAKELGFAYVPFEQLLKNSNIISLHVPLNEHTKHLINSHNIGLIKKGAYIINTARGGLIETGALIAALDAGALAGAALDVLEEECFIKEESQLLSKGFPKTCDIKTLLQNHALLKKANVIVTPHNAFNSREALERILETTVVNIRGFVSGKMVNVV